MSRIVFAVAAHPDDIEANMAGTMLLLKQVGYELHTMTVANGSCGSVTMDAQQIAAIRTAESRDAAAVLGATYHEPLVDDLNIYYTPELLAKLCAIVRQVDPEILLLPPLQDYMEDHTNTARLMVSAAFCRSMPNFPTDPPVKPVDTDVALYHCMPWGLQDSLRNPAQPHFFVETTTTIQTSVKALACHRSQKEWLDTSQGLDSYLKTVEQAATDVGKLSGKFTYAEGWWRHSHMGFAEPDFHPLLEALQDKVVSAS